MATRYKHTQIGHLLITLYAIVVLFLGYFCIMTNFHPLTFIALIIVLIILRIFSRLTVTVDDQMIKVQFGLSIVRKTFPLREIGTYRAVKNPWYYGWGIRFTPRGWLFNVSGFSAIELQMKDGKQYRIGTDDSDNLAEALGEALNQSPQ